MTFLVIHRAVAKAQATIDKRQNEIDAKTKERTELVEAKEKGKELLQRKDYVTQDRFSILISLKIAIDPIRSLVPS